MRVLMAGAEKLGVRLGPAQLGLFRRYYDELQEWNTLVNLTSVTGWEEVQRTHFLDSLSVSLAVPPEMLESGRFVDVGSGAGLPGVPLKIAFPGLRATLIDSTAKKTNFLAALKEALDLPDLDLRTDRAETLAHDPGLRESFDFVVCRAVASMPVLAELAVPFCRIGGIVVAQKAQGAEDEVRDACGAIEALGARLREIREVAVDNLNGTRCLVVLEKTNATPVRYPRRPGIPKKRPLRDPATPPAR